MLIYAYPPPRLDYIILDSTLDAGFPSPTQRAVMPCRLSQGRNLQRFMPGLEILRVFTAGCILLLVALSARVKSMYSIA